MGKVKSAIITAIVTLAVAVLMLFGLVSCNLPGGVDRYNSILSSIGLGSDLTGDAYAVLYPEGVISAEEYNLTVAENNEKAEEYAEKYVASSSGSFYVERTVLEEYSQDGKENSDAELLAAFAKALESDAAILSSRFGNRRYTTYSVSVVDGCALRVSVPTGFSYAAYSGNDNTSLTNNISQISTSISYLTLGGELTLRNTDSSVGWRDTVYTSQSADGSTVSYNLVKVQYNLADCFKSVSYYASGGSYAVKISLTDFGKEVISSVSANVAASDDTYIRFYVGMTNVINLTCESAISGSSFYIQVSDEATARNYAALLNSVATGSALSFEYSYDEVIYSTSSAGANSAMLLGIAALIIVVALIAFNVARYRLLGLVNSLMTIAFADALLSIIFLAGVQLTTIGVFTCLICLMLFNGCNFWVYESVRKESQAGRTIQAAVKRGYKNTLSAILELHIVLLVVSLMLTLICIGEASACGLILLIGTLSSYVLHWFGRFMWYTIMSPVRDKYKFCGFKREALDDED